MRLLSGIGFTSVISRSCRLGCCQTLASLLLLLGAVMRLQSEVAFTYKSATQRYVHISLTIDILPSKQPAACCCSVPCC